MVVSDFSDNIVIYNKNVDKFSYSTESKNCGSGVYAVDITGDGQWLYSVCSNIGSRLYKY